MPTALRTPLLLTALVAGATGLHAFTARLVDGPAESAYAEVLTAARSRPKAPAAIRMKKPL